MLVARGGMGSAGLRSDRSRDSPANRKCLGDTAGQDGPVLLFLPRSGFSLIILVYPTRDRAPISHCTYIRTHRVP